MKLSSRSLKELIGVNPDLVKVVTRAAELTEIDFEVTDGIRTIAEQKILFDRGATQTMNSKHLSGDAVDLTPFLNKTPRWEWPLIHKVAQAMKQASEELNVKIRWGGAWSEEFTNSPSSTELLTAQYVDKKKRLKEKPFLDGPHFELVK